MKRVHYSGIILLAVSLLAMTPLSAMSPNANDNAGNVRGVAAIREELKPRVAEKRAEIEARIEAKKAEVAEKLETRRLEACEKKEAKINAILDRSVAQSEKHLAVFEKIEERVKTFYTDKNLNVANYDTLLATVDEKHTAATAQIEAADAAEFACEDAESTSPTGAIKEIVTNKNDAIQEYRTALKDLIVAIKGASTSTDKSSDSSTETETDATTETESETEAN